MADKITEKNKDERPGSNEFVVNGYSFDTEEEYEKALEEKKSIERLMKKVDLDNKELLVSLYKGLITQDMLDTVIGFDYLCRLRELIINKRYAKASELPPIRTGCFRAERAVGYKLTDTKQKLESEKEQNQKYRSRARNLMIFNIALLIVIGLMMYIATTSSNVNVINYEKKLVDKYAGWESELTEREQRVREAEKRLGIE